jgi:hypothetical protein
MSSRLIGGDALKRRLRAIEKPRPLLREIQLRAVAEAKKNVPRKTGHTARTIAPGALTDAFTIVTAAGAAPYLEFGTRPHTIRPRNRSALSWTANKRLSGRSRTAGGRRFFAKVVHHPGTKAQPFLVPGAIAAIHSVGIETIVREWNKAA